MEYRIEHDSLGEVQVPTNRYWAAQTQRSFENFKIGSEKIPLDVIKAFAILKKSASVANRNLGKLDDERQKIISAVCEIRDCEIASHLQSYTLAILQSSFARNFCTRMTIATCRRVQTILFRQQCISRRSWRLKTNSCRALTPL